MKNKEKLILFISILKLSSLLAYNPIESLVTKYDAIVENIVIDQENKMKATTEISTNTQLLIISTGSVMSSEEDYQFKEYFSRSKKEILVGRLLIERFLGNSSYYHSYIETLPKPEEIKDYHHYSETMKEEFNKRSIIKYDWEDRKSNYESLFRKIPTNVSHNVLKLLDDTTIAFELGAL